VAVEDTWHRKDGTPSQRNGRGLRYRVRWPGVKARSFRTKGEADRYWLKVRTDLAKPLVDRMYVGDLVDRWLKTKKGLSPRGYRACLDASRHVREQWGDEVANDITCTDVEMWLAEMPYGKSLKSKVHQSLSGAFKTAPMLTNPCIDVRVGQDQRREATFLSVDELWAVADAAGFYRPMVLFLGTTGVRIGEACALNVGDVDLARGRVRVRKSKTGTARDVPVAASVLALLDLDRDRAEPLFVTQRGHRVLVDNWRARVFAHAVEAAGIEMTVHDLRHTAASLAIASGRT
jgi:integrase